MVCDSPLEFGVTAGGPRPEKLEEQTQTKQVQDISHGRRSNRRCAEHFAAPVVVALSFEITRDIQLRETPFTKRYMEECKVQNALPGNETTKRVRETQPREAKWGWCFGNAWTHDRADK